MHRNLLLDNLPSTAHGTPPTPLARKRKSKRLAGRNLLTNNLDGHVAVDLLDPLHLFHHFDRYLLDYLHLPNNLDWNLHVPAATSQCQDTQWWSQVDESVKEGEESGPGKHGEKRRG